MAAAESGGGVVAVMGTVVAVLVVLVGVLAVMGMTLLCCKKKKKKDKEGRRDVELDAQHQPFYLREQHTPPQQSQGVVRNYVRQQHNMQQQYVEQQGKQQQDLQYVQEHGQLQPQPCQLGQPHVQHRGHLQQHDMQWREGEGREREGAVLQPQWQVQQHLHNQEQEQWQRQHMQEPHHYHYHQQWSERQEPQWQQYMQGHPQPLQLHQHQQEEGEEEEGEEENEVQENTAPVVKRVGLTPPSQYGPSNQPYHIPRPESRLCRISTSAEEDLSDYIKMNPAPHGGSATLPTASRGQPPNYQMELSRLCKSFEGLDGILNS